MFGESVYIKESNVCKGYGIFAKRKIYKGEIITWYYGNIINNNDKNIITSKYAIEYGINNNKTMIGISDIKKISYGKGVAQFANDAICYDLTLKNNNSYFIQKGRYILLIASEDINKNEEILVSYGINYWINEIEKNSNIYDDNFKDTIFILSKLINIVEESCKCKVYEFKGIFDDYKIFFDLLKNKRWCIFSNVIHKDNNFYISLKWNSPNKSMLQIYYVCKTCNISDFNVLIKEIENGLVI